MRREGKRRGSRSRIMSAIKKKDTRPELAIRRVLHYAGYRYVLHRRDLPGTPDLVFPSRRLAMFVNGCFWHQHLGCRLAKQPKSRPEYWLPKLRRNVARDRRVRSQLRRLGWRVVVIWECEIAYNSELSRRLARAVCPSTETKTAGYRKCLERIRQSVDHVCGKTRV